MERLGAFIVTHNCISKGEPIVECILQLKNFINEIVVIDRWSTDETDSILRKLPCKLMFSTLDNPYGLYVTLQSDLVLMVDPNEVFDYTLLGNLVKFISDYNTIKNVTIPRIEVSHNFQKICWNTHLVHRIFPKNSRNWKRIGVTTNKTNLKKMIYYGDDYGFLWAFTNNFRDNWYNFASLKDVSYLPPNYFLSQVSMDKKDIEDCKQDNLWTCSKTPLHIPDIMHNLVGDVKYDPMKNLRRRV